MLSPKVMPKDAVSDFLYYPLDIFEHFREAIRGEEGLLNA
jgi:hypothetical protein